MTDQHASPPGSPGTSPAAGPDATGAPAEGTTTARAGADAATAPQGEPAAAGGPEGAPAGGPEGATTPEPDLQARIAELEDLRLRALADLDNFRKRVDRTTERLLGEERARVATEWLPVLDNLDLALGHAGDRSDPLIEGIRAVRDQAIGVLSRLGFPRQEQVGVPFDPVHHEAVSTVNDRDNPEGTVVEVVRPGYGDEHRQLRPASVVVATRDD
ncbi:MAG TPA: nucleotide exchange factor GrpE [Actinomadura sp.]|jgi:molecular chaperone GrpE|nr:nucleotide exchange factor GrpE [Actinomadura sp.]